MVQVHITGLDIVGDSKIIEVQTSLNLPSRDECEGVIK